MSELIPDPVLPDPVLPPEPVLLEPGDPVPLDLPADTPVYVRVSTVRVDPVSGGILADELGDGCIGQHYPGTNPECSAPLPA